MNLLLAQASSPASDSGAQEFLANLSLGMVAGIALLFTLIRFALLKLASERAPNTPSSPRSIAEIFESLTVALVLVFLIIRPFFVQAFFIPSESMEPTLLGHEAGYNSQTQETHPSAVKDHIFVNKFNYHFSDPNRGDIIVFRAPKNADQESPMRGQPQVENVLIKRCMGIPGDTLEVRRETIKENGEEKEIGVLYRNNERLEEFPSPNGYKIKEHMNWPQAPNAVFAVGKPLKLGEGEYFAMGDNRNNSNDSRYWGILTRSRIIGKASVIFLPLDRIRVLK